MTMPVARLLALTVFALLAISSPAGAIVGGEVTQRSWPHMAAMEFWDEESSAWSFRCGGSLVRPDVILTAAHCVDSEDGGTYPASNFRFLLGSNKRSSGGERIGATQVREHPEYDETAGERGDVALVKLARSSTLGAPIALAGPAEAPLWEPGDPATITGWGVEERVHPYDAFLAGDVSDDLKEAEVPVVSDADCQASLNMLFVFDPAHYVCAGEQLGGKDSCQGDSGGPMMVPGADAAWKQVGVVSFGLGCAWPEAYGVYSEVGSDPLRTWIEQNASAMSTASSSSTTTTTSPPPGGTTQTAPRSDSSSTAEPAPATTAAPPPATTASPAVLGGNAALGSRTLRLRLPARLSSLRAARRSGGFLLRLRAGETLRDVRATLTRRGRTLASGRRARLRDGGALRLRPRARRIAPGRAVLRVSARDARGQRVTASRTITLRR
jgi:secreted trypsin-like serine protease